MQISAVIITFNEERNIGRCIDSLTGVADEIVIVDSFSSDRTEEICREKGARFIRHPFQGHIEQKNYALSQAGFDVVLSLDADEALSETLRQSILKVKTGKRFTAYRMNRLTNYCGQWIRHSGWYPDRKLRLFNRRQGQWGGDNPHDKVLLEAGIRPELLAGDLLHYSYYTVEEHYNRARKYAEIAARAMQQKGRKGSWFRVFFSPVFKFIRNYVFRMGFLDGGAGWTICRIAALETYWKYIVLLRLQHNTDQKRAQ